jgi:hypothetical protein
VTQAQLLCRARSGTADPRRAKSPARASTGSCCAIACRISAATKPAARRRSDGRACAPRRLPRIPGLSERVIYRELFPKVLTLLDLKQIGDAGIAHIAARQELREMVAGFGSRGGSSQGGLIDLL